LRDCWEAELELPEGTAFSYKFVRLPPGDDPQQVQWESGPDRRALVQKTINDGCLIESEWEHVFVRFSIYFPTKDGQRLYVTGDPVALGRWVDPGPVPMDLATEAELLETGGRGRRWTLRISVPLTWSKFAYRYVLVDERGHQTIWEREPNRHAVLEQALNGVLECRDANFVASLDFDQVPPNLYIGPYPQTPEHIEAMHQAGITAVLNLQTDEDFAHRSISWAALEAKYKELHMQVIRYPIPDFDGDALERLLPDAVRALNSAVKDGSVVYVHCTAGMGRAPAVVVAYLVWCRGMSLPEALDHVKRHRKVAAPNVGVLEKVLRNPL
jgi:protein-tyrosine phosphatase